MIEFIFGFFMGSVIFGAMFLIERANRKICEDVNRELEEDVKFWKGHSN